MKVFLGIKKADMVRLFAVLGFLQYVQVLRVDILVDVSHAQFVQVIHPVGPERVEVGKLVAMGFIYFSEVGDEIVALNH